MTTPKWPPELWVQCGPRTLLLRRVSRVKLTINGQTVTKPLRPPLYRITGRR